MSEHDPEAMNMAGETSGGDGPAPLASGLQGHIGRYLRHLYDDVVQQPVPDRFVQLLEELERKTASTQKNGAAAQDAGE